MAALPSAAFRNQLEAVLGGRPDWQARPAPECLPTGIPELDRLTGGLPRGCLSEICGPASSGRTTAALAALAQVTAREEVCAVVDAQDTFDPAAAAAAGVDLSRVLWVRCGGNPEHALKAADLLVQAGGFGLILMDLGEVEERIARRIPLASWFRLRRAVEHTPSILLVVERQPHAVTCASLVLELSREAVDWSGAPGCSQLLDGLRYYAQRRKPVRAARASFGARVR